MQENLHLRRNRLRLLHHLAEAGRLRGRLLGGSPGGCLGLGLGPLLVEHRLDEWAGEQGLDGLPAVEAACQEAIDQGVFSAAVIINILARKRDPQPAAILSIPDALRLTHEPLADCARYDSLRRAS